MTQALQVGTGGAQDGSLPDAAILVKYEDAVRRFCRSRTRCEADADDAVQDTFMRFLQRRDRDVANAEAWLIRAAGFSCVDIQRRRAREALAEPAALSLEPTPGSVEDAALTSSLLVQLFKCIRPKDARLLTLLYMGGWSIEQVASELGVTPGNVRIMAMRARRRAKTALEQMGATAGAYAPLRAPSAAIRALRGWARGLASKLTPWGQRTDPQAVAFGSSVAAQVGFLILVVALVVAPLTRASGPAGTDVTGVVATAAAVAEKSGAATPSGDARQGTQGGTPAVHAAAAPAGGTVRAQQVIGSVLNPGANATVADTSFTSVTASPGFAQDHTLYAAGSQANGCYTSNCPVLFRSTDAGRSWQNMHSARFTGFNVLLPPSYPADPVIFDVGAAGLERSDDGGQTFLTVVPGVTAAAMIPGSAPGNASILLGTDPLLIYHENGGSISPGPELPTSVTRVTDVAAPTGGTYIVTGSEIDVTSPSGIDGVSVNCAAGGCVVRAVYPGENGRTIHVSPGFATDHVIAVAGTGGVAISRDGGQSFAPATVSPGAQVAAVAFSPTFAANGFAIVAAFLDSGTRPALFASADHATSFAGLRPTGLPASPTISTLLVLPDGSVLASVSNPDISGLGLRCSHDNGLTWRTAC